MILNEFYLTLFGSIGLILILLGYYLEHFKETKMVVYDFLNFLGALILTVYAWLLSNMIFVFLESIWTLVAGYYLVNYFFRGEKK